MNSKQRVKWYLESIDLSGNLKVISTNGPVYDYDLSPDQQLSIENNPLPAAFDQLWKAVVRKTNNNPISYSRIEKANVLTIIVPDRSKRAPLSPQEVVKNDNSRLFLRDGGNIGVGTLYPDHDLEVNGTAGMKSRVGTFQSINEVSADGEWHIILDILILDILILYILILGILILDILILDILIRDIPILDIIILRQSSVSLDKV